VATPPWRWTLRATALGTFATILVVVAPIRLAYESPSLHVAFETAAASIALLAAYLVLGHFRHTKEVDALLLACGLAIVGGVNLFLGVLPAALDQELGTPATWMSAVGRLLATAVLVAAAWAPPVRLRSANVQRLALLTTANVVFVLWLVLLFTGDRLPVALDTDLAPELSSAARLVGHPLVHGVQLAGALLFVLAAWGFLRRPGRGELSRWVAPACVFAGFANIHYFLFPSLYSRWFYTGDVFRLCFYLLLVTGVAREIWHSQAQARALAVLEARRRIARDLHDGLAQELSFIAGAAELLRDEPRTRPQIASLVAAAERALDESRRAVAALTTAPDEPLDIAVAQAAYEVANRVGTRLALDLDRSVRVAPSTREQLVRIVREAVTNAARHGQAETVTVALLNGDGLTLRITDDGSGFEPRVGEGSGFGLVSMSERAHALGGELHIRSDATDGTAVEVVLPQGVMIA
jgi:signal transduction histidine kinase